MERLGRSDPTHRARVLALVGELGSGKTTFVQGLAEALGVRGHVRSPTFVIMRPVATAHERFRTLWHIDCYRLDNSKALAVLGFEDILKDESSLVVIEWADRVSELLPEDAAWITFEYGKKDDERIVSTELHIKNLPSSLLKG